MNYLEAKNEIPVLGRWIVKYDDTYQMPQFVQGVVIGNTDRFQNGQQIIIGEIQLIDLQNKFLTTYNGDVYKLVGSGRRMILLNEGDLLEIRVAEKKNKSLFSNITSEFNEED